MTEHSLIRAAFATPTTADETTRTVEMVVSTATDPGDGLILSLRQLPEFGPAPVPVLLGHVNAPSEMAGRLRELRIERGQLIGVAEFKDAPAADAGWQLARSGSAVSVGATYSADDATPQPDGSLLVSRWRLREASLVPVGADPQALTRAARSIPPIPVMTEQTQTIATEQTETRADRAAQKMELAVRRAAAVSGRVDEATVERIIQEHQGRPEVEAVTAVVREHRISLEREAPVHAGHPARCEQPFGRIDESAGLGDVVLRAMRGERQDQPLWLTLRAAGIGHGSDPVAVWRSALSREGRWLSRGGGMHSTSDLPNLLTMSGNRRLQERFETAETGIRLAAGVRPLTDYRAASVLDVGLVGTAKKILEGGEITFGSVAESAASYKPTRHGLGLSFTPESLANDDLAALDLALMELADSMLDAEAAALVDLLEGAANGRNAPDGQALFVAGHSNTVSAGPLAIASIGTAVQKLREQKAVGGRYIAQDPAVLLVGTAHETTARQLLSDAINAAQSDDVNPWRGLQIAVEPRLSGTYAYILGNRRRPLELGRVTEAPVMTTETQFETGAYRAKAEHAFGVAICEHRSIVRIPTAS